MLKRILLTLMGLVFALGQICANANYFSKVRAYAIGEKSGMGKVYLSQDGNEGEPAYNSENPEESKLEVQTDKEGEDVNIYAYAESQNTDLYYFNGWSLTQDGNIVYKESPLKLSVKSSKETDDFTEVYAHFLAKVLTRITIEGSNLGTITATDHTNTITNNGILKTKEEVLLSATPIEGKKVVGWYKKVGTKKEFFSFESTLKYYFTSNATIGVEYVDIDTPVFLHKETNTPYDNLNDAISATKGAGTVVLVQDGTLQAGEYVVGKGVTLLIPYDDLYTVFTLESQTVRDFVDPTPYKTLTLADGAKIKVEGILNVSSTIHALNGDLRNPDSGITGPYGCIKMEKGSAIDVENKGELYTWGYITGEGNVTAKSGSSVYELFQIAAFRGGNASSAMYADAENAAKKVFPISQYYVQNIEAPLTINYGATEYVAACISAEGVMRLPEPIAFVGQGGMFELANGASFKKWYAPSRDRQMIDINGSANLNDITLYLDGDFGSENFVLPITNNMSISVDNGTFAIKNKTGIALLPDVELTVKENAILDIKNANVYVYDKEEWGQYVFTAAIKPPYFIPTPHYTRTANSLADAKLDIQGKVTSTGTGCVYTTENSANVCSTSGRGSIDIKNVGAETETYQVTQKNTEVTYVTIPITPARLYNEKTNTYTTTASAKEGTTYYYVHGRWQTVPMPGGSLLGDVDKDGDIDMDDVETLAKKLAGMNPEPYNNLNADVDNNGRLSVRDVVKLVEKLR